MATEQFGDIVIAPRVLEKKLLRLRQQKVVEGVYSLENKSVSDSLSKRSLWTWRLPSQKKMVRVFSRHLSLFRIWSG